MKRVSTNLVHMSGQSGTVVPQFESLVKVYLGGRLCGGEETSHRRSSLSPVVVLLNLQQLLTHELSQTLCPF